MAKKTQIQVLLIEDNITDAILLREALAQNDLIAFELTTVERLHAALEALQKNTFDVILLDLGLPDSQGLETFNRIQQVAPATPKVILSGFTDEAFALQAVQAGAQDYLVKGITGFASVARAIRYAVERQQAQAAVRASEERFRALIENGADDISLLDAEGNLLWESPAVIRNLGYPENAFVGQSIFELIHPEDKIWTNALFTKLIQTPRGRQDGVFRLQHADGTWRWVEAVVTNMLDNPSVHAIVVNYHDITERKRAEETLRKSEALYRQAMEVAGTVPYRQSYYGDSRTMKYEFMGEGIRQITGYGPEEFNTELWDSLVEEVNLLEDLTGYSLEDGIQRVRSGQSSIWKCEHRIRDRAGKIHWVFEAAVELYDEHGVTNGSIGTFQDITERKQAEERLRESEARFTSIFHTNPTRVSITSFEDSRFLDINESYLISTGYSRQEVIGHTSLEFDDWVNPQDRIRLRTLLEEQGSVQNFETRLRQKSGNILDILISAELVELFGQRCILSVGLDITNRKRDEEKLREANERFEQLANNIEEAFWITDAISGKDLYLSPAAGKIWGRATENMLNTPHWFFESVLPEDRHAVMRALEKQKKGERTETEYRIVQSDGSVHWIWDRAFPIFDDTDRVVRLAGIVADITERKQNEKKLIESNERFEQLANNIEEAFWITSAETGDEVYLSPASEKLWGQSIAELMKPNAFLDKILPEDRHLMETALIKQRYGERTEVEYRLRDTDGSIRWIWDRAFPIFDETGKTVRLAGITADVTQRKQAENALRQSEQRLRQVIDLVPHFIFAKDMDGRFILANQAVAEAYGTTVEDLTNKLDSDFAKSVEEANHFRTDDMDVINSGQSRFIPEESITDATGNIRILSTTKIPFTFSGSPSPTVLGVSIDITERKQAEKEINRHLTEFEALYENGLAVSRLLETHEIGERIIHTFERYLFWHHVTIRLLKPGTNELEVIAFNVPNLNNDEESRKQAEYNFNIHIQKVSQGLSGWVVETGKPVRTGNVHDHPQYVVTYPNILSGLYMPLRVGDFSIGVISVESKDPNAFTEQDERLLATLANQAAIAFENARLYQSAQQELQERKRAETALRTSETHYRELADSITDIFFELDHDLRYSHWNKASEILTGVIAKDAIGKSMREIFGESDEQVRIEKIYKDVLVNQHSRTFETPFIVNRQERAFEVNAYPSTRGVSVVAKDVTERKRSETIMQKRFELMEYAAQHSLEDIMQKTIDEVSDLTKSIVGFFHIMETDQATPGLQIWPTNTLNLFNVPVSEGRHRALEQAGVWADAVRQRRAIIHNDYESLSNKKSLPTGHAPIIREMVIPVIRNERILAVLGIANKRDEYTQHDLEIAGRFADYAWDITERKQMELALAEERNQLSVRVEQRTADLSRANANLARALRVKDEFMANMSHELRTPLNAILGLSESLAEQTAGPLNEKQQRYITTVSESGHHLLSLINDILDLAKIEAGQITLDVNKVDINSVCQASLRMIKQLVRKKNQEVVVEIEDKVSLMWADERRLKQMLVNLLGNAVKFTPDGGKIGLEVHGDQDANKVTFTIWDTGIGIKEADLPRLFQPFVQLDAGLAREASGTGLGLALVAQMARLHGGSASVTSQPGKGSRFNIMLPWEPALSVDTIERLKTTGKFRPVKFAPGQKPTILLIEDTEEVIMMLSDYLALNGFKIVTAHDGVEGVIQAQQTNPDLILMDIQMPRMDGFEATKKLRSELKFEHTPIIALTALAMPNDRERCLAAGMDEYITKPVHLRALVKIIENFLSGEKEIKPQ